MEETKRPGASVGNAVVVAVVRGRGVVPEDRHVVPATTSPDKTRGHQLLVPVEIDIGRQQSERMRISPEADSRAERPVALSPKNRHLAHSRRDVQDSAAVEIGGRQSNWWSPSKVRTGPNVPSPRPKATGRSVGSDRCARSAMPSSSKSSASSGPVPSRRTPFAGIRGRGAVSPPSPPCCRTRRPSAGGWLARPRSGPARYCSSPGRR